MHDFTVGLAFFAIVISPCLVAYRALNRPQIDS